MINMKVGIARIKIFSLIVALGFLYPFVKQLSKSLLVKIANVLDQYKFENLKASHSHSRLEIRN